jgi:hypothetical protein
VNGAVVIDNSTKMKDLQRESYFINLERKRKLGTAQKLREELEDDKRRASLQKKIAAKIKKEVRGRSSPAHVSMLRCAFAYRLRVLLQFLVGIVGGVANIQHQGDR